MKYILAFLILGLNTSLLAETKWEELQEIARNPKYVLAINEKTKAEIKLVDLGNGKYRIDSFKVNPVSQMLLEYEGKKELNDLCKDYFLFPKKTFRAKAVFFKSSGIRYADFVLANGESLKEEMIENPILKSELKVRDLSESDKTIWIDKTADRIKMGSDINQYYLNLFNSNLKESSAEKVEVDLTNLNGLACDIGLGNIAPVISQEISWEVALPTFSFWLKKDVFSEISNNYSNLVKNNYFKSEDLKAQEKRQLVLGWSVATAEMNLRTEENSVMPKILKNDLRRLDLIKALEKSKDGESLDVAWKRTFEMEIPKVKIVTRMLPLVSGNAEVLKVE